jgi:hypothetical protein
VTRLETVILSADEFQRKRRKRRSKLTRRNIMRKSWWSQRDLNPCLSLERAPSWARLDDGTSRSSSGSEIKEPTRASRLLGRKSNG